MYKILLILLTSTILFAETNQTITLNQNVKTDKTSDSIEFKKYQETIHSHKYAMILFWAKWAGPAQMMLPIYEEVKAKMGNNIFFIKYDVDKTPTIAGSLRVTNIPTLVLLKEGKEINRLVGVQQSDTIINFIKNNAKKPYNQTYENTFQISKKMQKKSSSIISKIKGIALVVNNETNQTKQIFFLKDKSNKIEIYISTKIQKKYPSILEGLVPIEKKEPKINKPKVKTKFYIDNEIKKKYANLIKLIKATESMDDDERQYWFDIMPSMTDSQISRLEDILETEKRKLEKLEIKYQKEIKTLNEKHLDEWKEFQLKKKQAQELNTTTTNYDGMIKKIEALKGE